MTLNCYFEVQQLIYESFAVYFRKQLNKSLKTTSNSNKTLLRAY